MRKDKQVQGSRRERKELARRLRSEDPGLDVVHPDAAGIDVGNEAHYVAVRGDRDSEPVRRFECFTADLYRMADWLRSCGVKTVAMQSTGVYWIPLYDVLEEFGFEVFLVNARHTKNLPGRKSDVQESQWLLKLHTYGLLNNSFQPPSDIRVLRTYWRQRAEHAVGMATCIQRMQKALTQMNIQVGKCNQRFERADRTSDRASHSGGRTRSKEIGRTHRLPDSCDQRGDCQKPGGQLAPRVALCGATASGNV